MEVELCSESFYAIVNRDYALLKKRLKAALLLYNGDSRGALMLELPSSSLLKRSHKYYTPTSFIELDNRRVKKENGVIIPIWIPQTKPATPPEAYVVCIYIFYSKRVEKHQMQRAIERMWGMLKKKGLHSKSVVLHANLYFIGEYYYPAAKRIVRGKNANLMEKHIDIKMRVLDREAAFSQGIYNTISYDTSKYFLSRAAGVLEKGNYEKSRNMCYGSLKRFLDYTLLIATALLDDKGMLEELILISKEYEHPAKDYLEKITELQRKLELLEKTVKQERNKDRVVRTLRTSRITEEERRINMILKAKPIEEETLTRQSIQTSQDELEIIESDFERL